MRFPRLLGAAALALLGACSGGRSVSDTLLRGNPNAPPPYTPEYTRGGLQARGGSLTTQPSQAAPAPSQADLEATARTRIGQADAIWRRAEALEASNPEAAGDLYATISDDYPETPRAAEARFRQGRAYVRAGEYTEGARALGEFMTIAPVN